jgi:hypothetical protein
MRNAQHGENLHGKAPNYYYRVQSNRYENAL